MLRTLNPYKSRAYRGLDFCLETCIMGSVELIEKAIAMRKVYLLKSFIQNENTELFDTTENIGVYLTLAEAEAAIPPQSDTVDGYYIEAYIFLKTEIELVCVKSYKEETL
jgi:hypothetical protein